MSLSIAAHAQITTTSGKTPAGVAPGAPAGAYSISGFENVNLYSGNLNFNLPLLKIGGRGAASTSINLTINSIRWQMQRVDSGTLVPGGSGGGHHMTPRDEEHFLGASEFNGLPFGAFMTDPWQIDPLHPYPPDYYPCTSCIPTYYDNYIPPPPPDLTPINGIGGGGGLTHSMPTPTLWGGLRPGYGPGVLQGRWMGKHGGSYPSFTYTSLLRLTFTAADGTEYELRDDAYHGEPITRTGATDVNRGKIFKSADGVSVVFLSDADIMETYGTSVERYIYPTGYLMMSDGSRYRIVKGLVKWLRDRHGNMLFFTYGEVIADYHSYNKVINITDSLGREVSITYDNLPYPNTPEITYDDISFRSFGGASYQHIKIWKDTLEHTLRSDLVLKNYGELFPGGSGEWSTVPYNADDMVSSVELPDGRRYYLRYNAYGEIARVVMPTGGAIEYDYNLFTSQGQPWSGLFDKMTIYRRVSRRRVYSSATTLESEQYYKPHYSGDGSAANEWKTEVAVEQHDRRNGGDLLVAFEKHYFYGYPVVALASRQSSPNYFYTDWKEGKEYKTETFDVVNGVETTPLRSVEQVWDKRANIPWTWGGPAYLAPAIDPRIVATKTRLLDTNQMMEQTVSYSNDEFNNVIETKDFSYSLPGVLDTHGDLLRITQTDFVTSSDYTNDNTFLPHLSSEQRVYTVKPETGEAILSAKSQTLYDEPSYDVLNYGTVLNWQNPNPASTARGNATTVRHWLNTNNTFVETHAQYDQCGNVRFSWDGRGKVSEVQYSSQNNAYAFAINTVTPIPDLDGVYGSNTAFVTSSTYDFHTGLVTSTTDANGQTYAIEYNDTLNRPTRVVRLWDGAWTSYQYGDEIGSLYVRTQSSLDATHAADAYQYFDGLGRSVRAFQSEGGTWLVSDTQYDALGRSERTSNPYRASSLNGAINPSNLWTTMAYDALGRVRTVTTSDLAQVKTDYYGMQVLVTDQAGRQRLSQQDALGRLSDVWEIKPNDSATEAITFPNHAEVTAGYRTRYSYDGLGNLRKVEQGAQARYFSYDSLSRLVRARNPEQEINNNLSLSAPDPLTGNNSWSLSYSYDANGNLYEKTEARGIKTKYEYDNLNRNTRVTYENDPTGTPVIKRYYDGATYGKGLLWKSEQTGASGTLLTVEAYDLAGRPLSQTQQFANTEGWGRPYRVQRSYNLAGQVTAQTYPSGHTATYEFDAAGRPAGFSGNLGDGVQRSYASGISYDEGGRMQEERYGTLTPLYHKLRYNVRGQLSEVRLSTRSRQQSAADWNRGCLLFYYSNITLAAGYSDRDNNDNVVRSEHWTPTNDANDNVITYRFMQDKYEYDELNRLTSVTENENGQTFVQQFKQAYTYDRYGNRQIDISAGATSNTPGINRQQFLVENSTNRLYAPGDMSLTEGARRMQYDKAGNLKFDNYSGEGERAYDAENRMTSASNGAGGVVGSYTYDADGRRVRRSTSAEGEVWQVYGMDGELLAEYKSASAPFIPTKEYGYRAGQLLVTAANGDEQRLTRFVYQLYRGVFARVASKTELQGQVNELTDAGAQGQAELLLKAKETVGHLFGSVEYGNRQRSDEQYVSDLYWTYFDRSTDIYTTDYWVGRLQSTGADHVTREQLRVICEQWGEFSTLVSALWGANTTGENERTEHFLWNVHLGARGGVPASSEIQAQLEQLNTASAQGQEAMISAAEQICREMIASSEYEGRRRTDEEYVSDLFAVFWQRTPDAGSWAAWIKQVTSVGRGAVLDSFASSTAFREVAGTLYRETLWLIPDQLGTTRMVVERTGSLAGIKRHDYLPFGEEVSSGVGGRTEQEGYVSDNVRQQFTSKERDKETGLDYFDARYYASAQGRFTGCDPISRTAKHLANPQRWNLYVYVINSPISLYDPNGEDDHGKGGGRVIDVFITHSPKDRGSYKGENWKGLIKQAKRKGNIVRVFYKTDTNNGDSEPTGARVKESLTSSKRFFLLAGHSDASDGGIQGAPAVGGNLVLADGAIGRDGLQSVVNGDLVKESIPQIKAQAVFIGACDFSRGLGSITSSMSPKTVLVYNNAGSDGLTKIYTDERSIYEATKVLANNGSIDDAIKAMSAVVEKDAQNASGDDKVVSGDDKVEVKRPKQ